MAYGRAGSKSIVKVNHEISQPWDWCDILILITCQQSCLLKYIKSTLINKYKHSVSWNQLIEVGIRQDMPTCIAFDLTTQFFISFFQYKKS